VTPYLSAEHRFEHDPLYRAVVDHLTMLLAKLEFTPTEVREAAIYACIRFEQLNMRAVYRAGHHGPLPPKITVDLLSKTDACEARARELARWLRADDDNGDSNEKETP
jgi:hypothetical protein